jgi:hypothetical protein
VILVGLFFIFSCNKSGRLPFQPDAAEICPIERFSSFATFETRDTITFSYDWLGRPVSSTRTLVGTGSPKYLFRYDGQGRLQDFIGAYENFGAEFWTRYTYSEDNRTIWDTTYTLVVDITSWPPSPPYADLITQVKKYDREGRVIQIITSVPPFYIGDTLIREVIRNIAYDARGDAQNPPVPLQSGQAYDDKINYHQTNKIWMQVDDQYSVHNPLTPGGYAYNRYGLPVQFGFNGNPGLMLFGIVGPDVEIDYECELPKGLTPGE